MLCITHTLYIYIYIYAVIDNGWPMPTEPEDFMSPRLQLLKDKNLLTHRILKGSHHLHLDPESATECSNIIGDFLLE